jgi:hypothetical protein
MWGDGTSMPRQPLAADERQVVSPRDPRRIRVRGRPLEGWCLIDRLTRVRSPGHRGRDALLDMFDETLNESSRSSAADASKEPRVPEYLLGDSAKSQQFPLVEVGGGQETIVMARIGHCESSRRSRVDRTVLPA